MSLRRFARSTAKGCPTTAGAPLVTATCACHIADMTIATGMATGVGARTWDNTAMSIAVGVAVGAGMTRAISARRTRADDQD